MTPKEAKDIILNKADSEECFKLGIECGVKYAVQICNNNRNGTVELDLDLDKICMVFLERLRALAARHSSGGDCS